MGTTKEVELPFNYFGKQDTPWGFPSAAFAGAIIINKNDYGLTQGGTMLGEDVRIEFSVELNPRPSEESEEEQCQNSIVNKMLFFIINRLTIFISFALKIRINSDYSY